MNSRVQPHARRADRLDWKAVIAQADLPEPITSLITQVVGRSRLWRSEKADLARELCCHFADGLQAAAETPHGSESRATLEDGSESRTTVEHLMHTFGNPKHASALIRRAKKRNRHWAHRAFLHTCQGIGALFLAGVLLYALLAWRFFTGEPTITRNYTAEYNETIEQIPESDRAYDLYIEATLALEPLPESLREVWPDIAPEHPAYQDATAYLEHSARALSLIHEAAARPRMGETLSNATDPRITEMLRKRQPQYTEQAQEPEENPALASVVLPVLGHLRTMYHLLAFDAHTAARHHQSDRAMQDIVTMLGLAEHAAEGPMLINSLVGLAINTGAIRTTSQIIHDSPDLFTDDQLRALAHRHAAFMDGTPRVNLSAERWFFEDAIQRIYTDDGNGNGHLNLSGMQELMDMASMSSANSRSDLTGPVVLAPITVSLIANRKTMAAKYDEFMTQLERNADLPMWEYENHSNAIAQIELLNADPIQRVRYFPIVLLMPALDRASHTAEQVTQQRDALLTGIALELYRRDNDTYPDTLDALVPAYLPAVPPDRFTGKPLHYALTDGKPRLWSVGTDRNDDGGLPPPEKRSYESQWRPRAQAQAYEQSDPARYDGDWLLWPILYEPVTGEEEE